MAVVQISKIQVRRGQKNSNSGIPQLSSAEFAWAVDSQELFIGNGSVLEGAPYVGNTKILTEHDNILDLASSYQFASNDLSISLSVSRSLQSKLDETVSVTDFGAVGDGSTDCVAAFETAFTQLFRNVNPNYKKVLLVPNGEYLFLSDLRIPSGVILKGETQHGAVLNIGVNNVLFITSDGKEIADFDSTNRPTYINISNLTIQRTSGQVVLSGVASSTFEKVLFQGDYYTGKSVPSMSTEPAAVLWNNDIEGIIVTDINFKSCQFNYNSIGIKCVQTVRFESIVKFEDTKFFVNDTSIYVIGIAPTSDRWQSNKWQINDCEFEEVSNQAFKSTYGRNTLIQRSKFTKCGTDGALSKFPTDSIVYFGEKINNLVIDCSSDRQQAAGVTGVSDLKAAFPEVYNGSKASFVDRNYAIIYPRDSSEVVAVFSAYNKFIVINYALTLDVFSRVGKITISIGDNYSQVSLTDEFQYSPSLTSSEGGAFMSNFEFSAALANNSSTNIGIDSSAGNDTLILSYVNPNPAPGGSLSFDVAYGV